MHPNALVTMTKMLDLYTAPGRGRTVYDIGAADGGLNYRKLLESRGWKYIGADIVPNPSVEIILPEKSFWPRDVFSEYVDLVITGGTMEHVRWPWVWLQRIKEIMNPGGLLLINTHAHWTYHPAPIDCYRFYPDGMAALAGWAGLKLIAAELDYGAMPEGVDSWAVMEK